MLQGIRLDEGILHKNEVLTDYRLGPQHDGNLDLILPGEIYISAPYQQEFVQKSPYKLRHIKKRYYLSSHNGSMPIKLIQQPSYYNEPVNDRVRFREVVSVHGSYVSLAIGGHRYLQTTLVDETGSGDRPDMVISVDETLAILEKIKQERNIDVVSLSSWDPSEKDGGIFQIEPYIRAIKKNFNVLLLAEVHLPESKDIIDVTYAMGADSVCYHIGNLCSHGHTIKETERERDFEIRLLRHAVSDFPPGSILAHITIGTNSFEESTVDIESLCRIKVLPILTLESLEVAHQLKFTAEQLAKLYAFVYDQANENGIKMNWFSRLAPFMSPIEGYFFVGRVPRLKLAFMNFYHSRILGGNITANLSNLRRKLRVKEIDSDKD